MFSKLRQYLFGASQDENKKPVANKTGGSVADKPGAVPPPSSAAGKVATPQSAAIPFRPKTPAPPPVSAPSAKATGAVVPVAVKPPTPSARATSAAPKPNVPAPLHVPTESAPPTAAKPAGSISAPAKTAASPVGGANTDLSAALQSFGAIQSILASEEKHNMVEIPCSVILAKLPENLRGPAWASSGCPDIKLSLDRTELMNQLRKGRVRYRVGDVFKDLPAGWVKNEKDAMLEIPLPAVVAAVPAFIMSINSKFPLTR